jgi:hypothetical protein
MGSRITWRPRTSALLLAGWALTLATSCTVHAEPGANVTPDGGGVPDGAREAPVRGGGARRAPRAMKRPRDISTQELVRHFGIPRNTLLEQLFG